MALLLCQGRDIDGRNKEGRVIKGLIVCWQLLNIKEKDTAPFKYPW